MATLFLPPSPSLFPVEHPGMEEDRDNDSIPERQYSSEEAQEWNADVSDSHLCPATQQTRTSNSRLKTTTETEEQPDYCNTPDTSMDTTVTDDEDDSEDISALESSMESSPSAATAIDREMDHALVEDDDGDDSISENDTVIPGGLSNLGNTCYMASAIQMLASLDPLMDRLLSHQQQRTNTQDSSLLNALLQLFTRLRKGETMRPNELKEVLDEKSSLFLGYDQQDAHEFITTLLDILDEEYKMQQKQDSDGDHLETGENSSEIENASEIEKTEHEDISSDEGSQENPRETCNNSAEDAVSSANEDELHSESEHDGGNVVVSRTQEQPVLLAGKEETESPSKRFKADVDEASREQCEENKEVDVEEAESISVLRTSAASFSALNVDEIGLLLHGEPGPGLISTTCCGDVTPTAGPKYKLVGGRMSINADHRYESVTSTSVMDHVPENDGDGSDDLPSKAVTHSEDNQQNLLSSRERSSTLDENQLQITRPVSPVETYLATEARVRLTCDSCKYTRTHKETFWHLSLELEINTTSNSVQDGLARFFAPEQRQLKCEKCFCETATQTMQITKLPKALLLHFKRFIVEVSDDYSSISYRKNTSPVAFDTQMSVREHKLDDEDTSFADCSSNSCVLSEFLAPDCVMPCRSDYLVKPCYGGGLQLFPQQSQYSLKSVVNHIGSSASCGHYTADCRRKIGRSEQQWLRFNDCYVSRITETQATEGAVSTAYMVLYEMD